MAVYSFLNEAVKKEGRLAKLKNKIKSMIDKRKKKVDKYKKFIKDKKNKLEKKLSSFKKSSSYKLSEAAAKSKNTYYDVDEAKLNKKISALSDPDKFAPYLKVKNEILKYKRNPESLTQEIATSIEQKIGNEDKKMDSLYYNLYYKANEVQETGSDTDWERMDRENDNDNVITVTFDGPDSEFPKKIEKTNDKMKSILAKLDKINDKYYDQLETFCDFTYDLEQMIYKFEDSGADENMIYAWWTILEELDYAGLGRHEMGYFILSYYDTISDAIEDNIDILYKIGYYEPK